MRVPVLVLVGCLSVLTVATRASAQTLAFNGGRVTVHAVQSPISQLLAAWARLGGTEIVNGDKVTGVVTLSLVDVPESVALAALLEGVTGYVVVPRDIRPAASESTYARILVLPSSSALATPPGVSSRASTPSDAWPGPVNQDLVFDDPIPVIVIDAKNPKPDVWPMPINGTLLLDGDQAPAAPGKKVPDVPWPMPVNEVLDDDDRVAPARPARAGADVWPMPLNGDESLDLDTEAARTTVIVDEEGPPAIRVLPAVRLVTRVPGRPLPAEHAPALPPSAK